MRLSIQTPNYSDFKNLIASLPTKGTVYYNGMFSAVFVSSKQNYSVTFTGSSAPASFASDFPSAISGTDANITPSEGVELSTTTYSDFVVAIDSTSVNKNGNIYYFDDTAAPNFAFSAMFVSAEGNVVVRLDANGITSPPSTFASDWPLAIAMAAGQSINNFIYQ